MVGCKAAGEASGARIAPNGSRPVEGDPGRPDRTSCAGTTDRNPEASGAVGAHQTDEVGTLTSMSDQEPEILSQGELPVGWRPHTHVHDAPATQGRPTMR